MSRSCYLDFSGDTVGSTCQGPACLDWAFIDGDGNLVRLPVCGVHAPDGTNPDEARDSVVVHPSTSSEDVRRLILVNQIMAS